MTLIDFLNPLKNVPPKFTAEQLSEIEEWFDENAKPLLVVNQEEPVNAVTVEQVMEFLALKKFHRRSYRYPSYADIMNEAEFLKVAAVRMFAKGQFIYVLNKFVMEPDVKHELKLAYKVFDTEKRDFLEIEELRAIVTSYADSFDEAEVIELLRDANIRGDGNIFYENFVESMFSIAPELYEMSKEYLYEDPDEDPSVPPLPPEPEPEEPPPPPPPPPPEEVAAPAQPAKEKKGKKK